LLLEFSHKLGAGEIRKNGEPVGVLGTDKGIFESAWADYTKSKGFGAYDPAMVADPTADLAKGLDLEYSKLDLEVFIGREIECGPYVKEPGELGPIVRAVGHYVLDRRVQFGGRETIGTEENPIGQIALDRTRVGADSQAVYRVLLGEVGNGQ
jgi:hypothetical protein